MKSTKRIGFWLSALALIVLGVILMFRLADNAPDEILLPSALTSSDWTLGNKESKIVLIEYSDFQCPACSAYHSLTKTIVDEFGRHIVFSYRHFPLEDLHPLATLAAQASEAAGLQGKFWEMHDMLFEKQQEWSSLSEEEALTTFSTYASSLGIDARIFDQDITSKTVMKAVEEDQKSAEKAGLYYTPTLFFNGKMIQNPPNLETFRTLIRETINNQK